MSQEGHSRNGKGRAKRPSALMKAASSVGEANVDASLEDFIARANETLLDVDGWGLEADDQKQAEALQAEQEARESAASYQARLGELESQLAKTRAEAEQLTSKLAATEARAAEAEVKADELARVKEEVESSAFEAHPSTAVDALPPKKKLSWVALVGAFAVGGALVFGATELLRDGGTAAPQATETAAGAAGSDSETGDAEEATAESAAKTVESEVEPEATPLAGSAGSSDEADPELAEAEAAAPTVADEAEEATETETEPEPEPEVADEGDAPVVTSLPPKDEAKEADKAAERREARAAAEQKKARRAAKARKRAEARKRRRARKNRNKKKQKKQGGIVDPFAQ